MKKKLFLFLSVVALIIITGCNNNAKPSSTGTNTSSGSGSDSKEDLKLSENITSSGAITADGKLVVMATNGNNVAVDMSIEVEFYDANGTIVGNGNDMLEAVGPKAEIATEIYGTPDSFNNYKIYVDVEKTDNISYFDKLELTHNNNGEDIIVQVKNKSDDVIEYMDVSVVYYKENKVVGYDDDLQLDVKAGRSGNFTLHFPYDKRYKDVSFDNYKVYINQAYSYNY